MMMMMQKHNLMPFSTCKQGLHVRVNLFNSPYRHILSYGVVNIFNLNSISARFAHIDALNGTVADDTEDVLRSCMNQQEADIYHARKQRSVEEQFQVNKEKVQNDETINDEERRSKLEKITEDFEALHDYVSRTQRMDVSDNAFRFGVAIRSDSPSESEPVYGTPPRTPGDSSSPLPDEDELSSPLPDESLSPLPDQNEPLSPLPAPPLSSLPAPPLSSLPAQPLSPEGSSEDSIGSSSDDETEESSDSPEVDVPLDENDISSSLNATESSSKKRKRSSDDEDGPPSKRQKLDKDNDNDNDKSDADFNNPNTENSKTIMILETISSVINGLGGGEDS